MRKFRDYFHRTGRRRPEARWPGDGDGAVVRVLAVREVEVVVDFRVLADASGYLLEGVLKDRVRFLQLGAECQRGSLQPVAEARGDLVCLAGVEGVQREGDGGRDAELAGGAGRSVSGLAVSELNIPVGEAGAGLELDAALDLKGLRDFEDFRAGWFDEVRGVVFDELGEAAWSMRLPEAVAHLVHSSLAFSCRRRLWSPQPA